MKYRLGLSAENITQNPSPMITGVGLLRGEYIYRRLNQYVTVPEARDYARKYIKQVATIFYPQPVWYRTIEMEVTEINILEGADYILEEKTTMLGLRGIRRSIKYKSTFLLELQIIADLAEEFPNLHILLPFVYDPSEVAFVKDCLAEVHFRNQLGIMAEIPSTILCLEDFFKFGITNITLGMNDLTSLVLGAHRSSELMEYLHPAVKRLVAEARAVTRGTTIELSAAGYITKPFIDFIDSLDYDYAVVHYSKFPEIFGSSFSNLPDLQNLQEIKRQTRDLIERNAERLAVEKWKRSQNP